MTTANQALTQLLHQIRSPLAAIYTAGMMLEEMPPDTPLSRVKRQVQLIHSSVEEARRMMEEAEALLEGTEESEASSSQEG